MQRPIVSVITITYNHEQYIKQALDSILSQVGDNFELELIVADDASTDGTQAIIKRYEKKYPNIIKPILRRRNRGIQLNLIDALKRAKGKYIALCEGDDYWINTQKLSRQIALLESDNSINISFHPTKVFFDDGSYPDSKYPMGRVDFTPERLMTENFIPTNSVVYRRTSYRAIKSSLMPFDWYLHAYHLKEGRIGFMSQVMSAYRRHRGGAWWNSHGDSARFWADYGPDMLGVLKECREIFAGNAIMMRGISKGEFRIINEMFDHSVDIDKFIVSKGLLAEYIIEAMSVLRDLRLASQKAEQEHEDVASHLSLENTQKSEEIELLKRDLATYQGALTATQRDYDSLRRDLKRPLGILRRIGGRIVRGGYLLKW